MKIAAYLRVSTDDQNTTLQRDALASFCRFKNYSNVTYFVDQGESGLKTNRPQLDKMLSMVRNKEFDAVLVWKLDRLGRSAGHLITLLDELNRLNVSFISLHESMDSTTPMGKAMFGVMAVMAQLERDNISMRTKAALKSKKDRGERLGAPIIHDHLAIKNAFKLNPDVKSIMREFNISRAQLYRIIKK